MLFDCLQQLILLENDDFSIHLLGYEAAKGLIDLLLDLVYKSLALAIGLMLQVL